MTRGHGGLILNASNHAMPANWSILSTLSTVTRSLRHRNYRLYFFVQIVSISGTWMQSVAQSWLVYRLTGSAALLGVVGFASQFPVFVLAPLAGILADRTSRHRVVVVTQVAAMVLAFVLAALTLFNAINVWEIIALAAAAGVVNALEMPARQAFVVEMVGHEDLTNAIALNSSIFNLARSVGPTAAGLLVASVGEGWCFFINGASYIGVVVALYSMRLPPSTLPPPSNSVLDDLKEGWSFVWTTFPIRGLLLLLGTASLLGMPYVVLMPVFAEEILKTGARGLGLLMGATGVGAFLAAVTLAARSSIRGLGRWIALSSIAFGISLILFSFSKTFWLSMLLLVPVGYFMMVQMASSNTLIQSMTPDRLRGRAMSVYSMMILGMAPFGALIAGVFASHIGAPWTVAIGGVACVIGGVVFRLHLPAFRIEARRLIVALASAGGEPPGEATGTAVSDDHQEEFVKVPVQKS